MRHMSENERFTAKTNLEKTRHVLSAISTQLQGVDRGSKRMFKIHKAVAIHRGRHQHIRRRGPGAEGLSLPLVHRGGRRGGRVRVRAQ